MTTMELIGAVVGSNLVSSLTTFLATRKKQSIDADQKIRDTIMKILEDERKDNETCEKRVIELTNRVETLISENSGLRSQVTELKEQITLLTNMVLAHYAKV